MYDCMQWENRLHHICERIGPKASNPEYRAPTYHHLMIPQGAMIQPSSIPRDTQPPPPEPLRFHTGIRSPCNLLLVPNRG